MTEFAKMKISFALALLGTLFALHPFLDRVADRGFNYLGYHLKVFHAYALIAGLLSFCVYCYAVALMSERPHSRLEKLGNYSYAMAVMILPISFGLFLSSVLANELNQTHLAWAAPATAVVLGGGWLALTQLMAWRLRGRLGEQDRIAKMEQLAGQESDALGQAREMFEHHHYDLSVIEAWRALEARLRQVLLARRIISRSNRPQAIIDMAIRKGLLHEPALGVLQDLRRHWNTAIGTEPLTREAADEAISAARHILATVPVHDPDSHPSLSL